MSMNNVKLTTTKTRSLIHAKRQFKLAALWIGIEHMADDGMPDFARITQGGQESWVSPLDLFSPNHSQGTLTSNQAFIKRTHWWNPWPRPKDQRNGCNSFNTWAWLGWTTLSFQKSPQTHFVLICYSIAFLVLCCDEFEVIKLGPHLICLKWRG